MTRRPSIDLPPRDPPLWQWAVRQLDRDEHGVLSWRPGALDAVQVRLKARLSGRDIRPTLEGMMRLLRALGDELRSPAAAAALAAAIRTTPGALGFVERFWGGLRKADFEAVLGRAERRQAPRLGHAAGAGTLSVKSLLNPMDNDRRRAVRRGHRS